MMQSDDLSWETFGNLLKYLKSNTANHEVQDSSSHDLSPTLLVRHLRRILNTKHQHWCCGVRVERLGDEYVMVRFVGVTMARFQSDPRRSEYQLPMCSFWELVTKHFGGLCLDVPPYSLDLEKELKTALSQQGQTLSPETALQLAAE